MTNNDKKCEHLMLPLEIGFYHKDFKDHNKTRHYGWRDTYKVMRVYCAKCGKSCYPDFSGLKS